MEYFAPYLLSWDYPSEKLNVYTPLPVMKKAAAVKGNFKTRSILQVGLNKDANLRRISLSDTSKGFDGKRWVLYIEPLIDEIL